MHSARMYGNICLLKINFLASIAFIVVNLAFFELAEEI